MIWGSLAMSSAAAQAPVPFDAWMKSADTLERKCWEYAGENRRSPQPGRLGCSNYRHSTRESRPNGRPDVPPYDLFAFETVWGLYYLRPAANPAGARASPARSSRWDYAGDGTGDSCWSADTPGSGDLQGDLRAGTLQRIVKTRRQSYS